MYRTDLWTMWEKARVGCFERIASKHVYYLGWNRSPAPELETQMYRTDFWTLWEKARVGCFERIALKHVYYLGWNRSPAPAGCMRQVLGPGALGRPRGIGWRGRWEGGSGWGIPVSPWLIHVNVWQKPLQYCKVISLQLIKINERKKKRDGNTRSPYLPPGKPVCRSRSNS